MNTPFPSTGHMEVPRPLVVKPRFTTGRRICPVMVVRVWPRSGHGCVCQPGRTAFLPSSISHDARLLRFLGTHQPARNSRIWLKNSHRQAKTMIFVFLPDTHRLNDTWPDDRQPRTYCFDFSLILLLFQLLFSSLNPPFPYHFVVHSLSA